MATGVSIVIPTWNRVALIKRFLPSIIDAAANYSRSFHAPTEIIIVDDASTDETVAWLAGEGFRELESKGQGQSDISNPKSQFSILKSETLSNQFQTPELLFVRNEINRGFGETSNRGFEAARFPLVFLLNNDVEPERASIAPLVENFRDPEVFAAHCRVFEMDSGRECGTGKLGSFARGFIRVHRSYATSPVKESANKTAGLYSIFAGGGSAMFDRLKFLEMGGFEPLLSPFYWEDVELSYRAWKRGYTVVYEPRSIAHHQISSTIGTLNRRRVRRIEQRNRLIYHWIHLQDRRMIISHALWVLILVVTAPVRFKPGFILSFAAALKLLPGICRRRKEEKRAARRTDKDVFAVFDALVERDRLFIYDDYEDLKKFREADSNGLNRN